YGNNEFYTSLMDEVFEGWDKWNKKWKETVFHKDGILICATENLEANPQDFENQSYLICKNNNIPIKRINTQYNIENKSTFSKESNFDGYFNEKVKIMIFFLFSV